LPQTIESPQVALPQCVIPLIMAVLMY